LDFGFLPTTNNRRPFSSASFQLCNLRAELFHAIFSLPLYITLINGITLTKGKQLQNKNSGSKKRTAQ